MIRRRARPCVVPALALLALYELAGCDDDSSQRACSTLSISECSSRPYCRVVTATQLDEERQCSQPTQPVTCQGLEPCDDALTLARDADGQLFLLPNTCIPDSWEDASEAGSAGDLEAWPVCE